MLVVHEGVKHPCSFCDDVLSSVQALRRHQKSFHQELCFSPVLFLYFYLYYWGAWRINELTFRCNEHLQKFTVWHRFSAAFRIHLILTWIRIHLSIIVDPNPDPRIHIWKKRIRIRFQSGFGSEYLFFIFFIKKFMSDKLKCLILLPPKFRFLR